MSTLTLTLNPILTKMKSSPFYGVFFSVALIWSLAEDNYIGPKLEVGLPTVIIGFTLIIALFPKDKWENIFLYWLFAFIGSVFYVLIWSEIWKISYWIVLLFIWPLAISYFDYGRKHPSRELNTIAIVILFGAIYITGITTWPNFPARFFVLGYNGIALIFTVWKLEKSAEQLLYCLYWAQISISLYLIASRFEDQSKLPYYLIILPIGSVCVLQAGLYLREIPVNHKKA